MMISRILIPLILMIQMTRKAPIISISIMARTLLIIILFMLEIIFTNYITIKIDIDKTKL